MFINPNLLLWLGDLCGPVAPTAHNDLIKRQKERGHICCTNLQLKTVLTMCVHMKANATLTIAKHAVSLSKIASGSVGSHIIAG